MGCNQSAAKAQLPKQLANIKKSASNTPNTAIPANPEDISSQNKSMVKNHQIKEAHHQSSIKKSPDHTPLKKVKKQTKITQKKKQSRNSIVTSNGFTQQQNAQLEAHNNLRKKHHAQSLIISKWLCERAQRWADHLGQTGKTDRSDCIQNGNFLGENIYSYSGGYKACEATNNWYDEIRQYDYSNGEKCWAKCNHITQILWKNTQEVGFGFSRGVCVVNYFPGGNIMGGFKENVLKP